MAISSRRLLKRFHLRVITMVQVSQLDLGEVLQLRPLGDTLSRSPGAYRVNHPFSRHGPNTRDTGI